MHYLVFDKRIPFWPEKGGPKFGLPCMYIFVLSTKHYFINEFKSSGLMVGTPMISFCCTTELWKVIHLFTDHRCSAKT